MPWLVGKRATSNHPPIEARALTECRTPNFLQFFNFFFDFFFGSGENGPGLLGEWARAFGRMGVQHQGSFFWLQNPFLSK
jgi:hypothetical protein